MLDSDLQSYAERELMYQVRKGVSTEIRRNAPEGEPMVTGITVMLGTILAMAAFSAMLGRSSRGRARSGWSK